jgi:hypothetical protein
LGLQVAFGTVESQRGIYRRAGIRSLKRVTGRFLHFVRDFIAVRRNLFWIFCTKRQQKIVKTISAHSKILL